MQYKPISLHYKQKHITMKKQMKQIALPLFLGGLIACSPKTAVMKLTCWATGQKYFFLHPTSYKE